MGFNKKIMGRSLIFLYVFLYFSYILFIRLAHSSFSIVSISAILLPFLLLLLIVRVLWKRPEIKHNRRAKKKLTLMMVIGTIPLFICVVMLGLNEYKTHFTTEKWMNHLSERVYIVDDLINTYELVGKTKSDVVALLGPPTETEYFKSDTNVVYYLGDERGIISIDSEWLVIDFDDNQIVKAYDVRTD